ncbi:TPR repeat:Sel1-like repeat:Sel1-like repeat [Acidisarcina polymorpha]|uniref:TPR repeat:Sel1-like repeat:Sel1-like repeat n=1 Tax=Acidisarcina polymorpha TaxID=2211140 RepID=A0A2Z5GAY3_9BACT|nr:tetratricopeptide repeat protein [Acidisarcina polymorpha]AXC15785.1 TPR repeat:Sel1-like repeat:Sel1-like repeat [Acidisarcina polymorpha]
MDCAFPRLRKRLARTRPLAAAWLFLSLAAGGSAEVQSSPGIRQPALKLDPRCPGSEGINKLLMDSSAALQQGNYAATIQILQPFSSYICDPRVNLLLAAAFESSGDLPAAEQTLRQALSDWPANTAISTSLAREYLGSGEAQNAAEALRNFRATSRTPWQEIQMGVTVFLAAHQLEKAKALAEFGYRNYPSSQSLLLFANALQLEGRYKEVIALLESQKSIYQNSAPFLATLAESQYDAAIYDRARTNAERAISLDGNLYAAHYLLGNILLKLSDPEPAAAEYRKALELEPDQPRTYYYLALALRAQHDENDEEAILAKAIALDDHYALAHCEMGRILLNQDRLADAVAQLNLAVDDNASSEQAYYLLSRAYSRLGDKENADAMAKRLTAIRKNNHRGSTRSLGNQ